MGVIYPSVEEDEHEQGLCVGRGAQAWWSVSEPTESSPHRQEPELPLKLTLWPDGWR